jgi:hypothetical protein
VTQEEIRRVGWLKDQLHALREHLEYIERISQLLGDSQYATMNGQPTWMAVEIIRGGAATVLRGWNLANYLVSEAEKQQPAPQAELVKGYHSWRSRLPGLSPKS